ncbi:MAG: helix-turn-helix transcriptional regulator [Planctomycetes bacterium]|nr:helix-turn-helix transcriptional regulator [Planctomycetota bacterium]
MSKTIDHKPKRMQPLRRGLTWRFILLDADEQWRARFGTARLVACCQARDIRDVAQQASRDSLWISFASRTTDALLRNLNLLCAAHHGRRPHLGNILLLEPPRSRSLPILHSWFGKVIGETPGFKTLPLDQLADVLCAPQEEARDLFIGGAVDIESAALSLVRGNLERMSVPLNLFPPSGASRPSFRRFELDDYGHTIRFGEYEAAADAILYEIDPDYRNRINAKRRAEEKGFGPSLRRLRLQRGLERDGFPGITPKTIARLERGEVGRPHAGTLSIIANRLGVEPDQIETF